MLDLLHDLGLDHIENTIELVNNEHVRNSLSLVVDKITEQETELVNEILNHHSWDANYSLVRNNYHNYYVGSDDIDELAIKRIAINLTLFEIIDEEIYDLYFHEFMSYYSSSIKTANDLANIEFEVVDKSSSKSGYIVGFPSWFQTILDVFSGLRNIPFNSYYGNCTYTVLV